MHGPNPAECHPLADHPRVGFLKPLVNSPAIEVGDYTYYDDPEGPQCFQRKCVLYHYPFLGDRLVIGRFCALATGAQFIMSGANHVSGGFSTFPFNIFGQGWEAGFDDSAWVEANTADTVIGNDVWLGRQAVILPGVQIADGAIVAAHAVVSRDVPAYAVVAGNPARVVKRRFPDEIVERLVAIAWWNWPVEKITRHLGAIRGTDLARLEAAA